MGFNQWVFDGGSALGIRYQALGTRHWELGTSPTLVGMGDSKINLKRFNPDDPEPGSAEESGERRT